MSNLSELSVQLRRLQSEKNAQAGEVDRLQRQLRIVAELQGVSVADVRAALQAECAAEAHGELRSLVGTLQARVAALGLEGGGGGGAGRTAGGARGDDGATEHGRAGERFNQEAAARARAALELRVGELEEVEASLRAEIEALYKKSQGLTDRNASLETQVLQQQAQLEQWERRWQARDDEDARRGAVVPAAAPSTGSYNYANDGGGGAAAPPVILLHNAPQSQVDDEHARRLIAAEGELVGERQRRSLVECQLASAQKSYELKIDQYQHRCQFLEEQITDLEQQMSSLYAAFGIMQSDTTEERNKTEVWKRTMLESDAAIAQEASKRETEQRAGVNSGGGAQSDQDKRRFSPPHLPRPSSPPSVPPPSPAAVAPTHPHIAQGPLLLLLDHDGRPLPPNHVPSTPRSRGRKLSFKLSKSPSKRGDSVFKFKKQQCVLHGSNGLYQLRYGATITGPVSGVLEFITAGCSSIAHTPRCSGLPFGFEIMINGSSADAPVLCCAAETEGDFLMWMSALTGVMDGSMESQHEGGHLNGLLVVSESD